VLELGLGLPAWNKIGAYQAVQPFPFRATGAEPHAVQFAIPARVKIPSRQRVPASTPVRRVSRRNNQYPGLWQSWLDEHELQVGAAPTRDRPARGPHLVVRQGKASGTKLPLKLLAILRKRHQVQILVRSGPAADEEVHRYPTGQPHRRRDVSESTENVEDHDWLDAHAFIITWAESQANSGVGVLRWLVGARRAMPHRGRTLDMRRTERPVSRDKAQKVHAIDCGRMQSAVRTFCGPLMPDGPCAISDQPAESAGPRLGAGFQDAAREARGRSLRTATPLFGWG
jgi:hypothetical protein